MTILPYIDCIMLGIICGLFISDLLLLRDLDKRK
jgi:hypothetical protein